MVVALALIAAGSAAHAAAAAIILFVTQPPFGADFATVNAVFGNHQGITEGTPRGGDLYIRYADHIYGYVASIVRDDYEAEDVTQQVFAKLMTSLPKYEPRDVPFSAWILRVARNAALDHLRQKRAIPCEEVRELDVRDDDSTTIRHRSLGLRDALATLPEDQRQVLMMRHLLGLTPGEIAGRLGRSEPSIHGLHHRGRGALRVALSEMGCGPTTARSVTA